MDKRHLWVAAFCGLLAAVSVVPSALTPAKFDYDSFSYFSSPSVSSGRLPLVPLVYLILRYNVRAISVVQALLGGVCWSVLLWELSYVRERALRLIVMGAATWLACSTYVVGWYTAILSESISVSLLALLVALVARWQRTGWGVWGIAVVVSLSAWTRSTSAYVVLAIGAVGIVYGVFRSRSMLAQSSLAAVMGLAATVVSGRGVLWQQPFLHSMSERILLDPGLTAWFVHHGMPLSESLRRLAGPYTVRTDAAYRQSPALAAFRHWMDRSGKADYAWFLLTHPLWILEGAFGRHEELGTTLMNYYATSVRRPWLPSGIRDLLLNHRQDSLLVVGLADIVALAYAGIRRSWTRTTWIWIALIGVGLAMLALDWAGDSWEVGRHSVEGTILTALAGLLLLCSGHIPVPSRSGQPALLSRHPRMEASAANNTGGATGPVAAWTRMDRPQRE